MNIVKNKSTPVDVLYQKALEYCNKQDYDNYAVYMVMSANLKYDPAIYHLHRDYTNEMFFLKQDHSITKTFYEQTFEYSYSANYLGYMYYNGEGVPQNYAKAKELYEMAIEKGNEDAMTNLGVIYYHGNGVSQDYIRAKELFEMAYENGNGIALTYLVILYKTKHDFDERSIVDYFIKIGHGKKLKEIYNYSDFVIKIFQELYDLKIENKKLKDTNNLLKTHIDASPDGAIFFETMKDWNLKLGSPLNHSM